MSLRQTFDNGYVAEAQLQFVSDCIMAFAVALRVCIESQCQGIDIISDTCTNSTEFCLHAGMQHSRGGSRIFRGGEPKPLNGGVLAPGPHLDP